MIILAVESSCDETAVAVVRDGREVLSDAIISQIEMHTIYGGVVPEIASRKHLEAISLLAQRAIDEADITRKDIDAVAATCAPGLIGAVLVGVNFAKAAAYARVCPLSLCTMSVVISPPITSPIRIWSRPLLHCVCPVAIH